MSAQLEDAWKEYERTGEICNSAEGLLNHCTALTDINRLQSEENKQLAEDNAELLELVKKIHLIMRNTKELPDDYTHEDVGELDDRFNEISGLNQKLYLKHIYDKE